MEPMIVVELFVHGMDLVQIHVRMQRGNSFRYAWLHRQASLRRDPAGGKNDRQKGNKCLPRNDTHI